LSYINCFKIRYAFVVSLVLRLYILTGGMVLVTLESSSVKNFKAMHLLHVHVHLYVYCHGAIVALFIQCTCIEARDTTNGVSALLSGFTCQFNDA